MWPVYLQQGWKESVSKLVLPNASGDGEGPEVLDQNDNAESDKMKYQVMAMEIFITNTQTNTQRQRFPSISLLYFKSPGNKS